jgi:hypothetical protein
LTAQALIRSWQLIGLQLQANSVGNFNLVVIKPHSQLYLETHLPLQVQDHGNAKIMDMPLKTTMLG